MNSSDKICKSLVPECLTHKEKYSVSCYIEGTYFNRTFKIDYDSCKQQNTAQWRGTKSFVCDVNVSRAPPLIVLLICTTMNLADLSSE